MIWRVLGITALVLIVSISAILSSDLFIKESKWDRIASDHGFGLLHWEFDNLFDKWIYRARQVLYSDSLSEKEKVQLVEDYLSLNQEIGQLENNINKEKAEGNGTEADIRIQQAQLADLKSKSTDIVDEVEEILEGQISGVLADGGLSLTLKLGSEAELLFPPVDFKFEARPNLLIISPRNTIMITNTILLKPDISLEDIENMEQMVEDLNYSGLVEGVGAIATYPSIVPQTYSLQSVLFKVAHEWLHHYLFFRPLGQNYWANYDMTAINETVADIAGSEIGLFAYQRYYGIEVQGVATVSDESGSAFDFNKEMRDLRIEVDKLLGAGDIDGAESYMEERRQFLAANGYYIRKLNQAFFAFHGTYADSPTSVSPIGDELRELRNRSSSVGDFIRIAAGITSHGELLDLIDR